MCSPYHAIQIPTIVLQSHPISYYLKILGKMQRRATLWILGAFKTSPSFSIKAITGLIPIKLHLQKLGRRSQLWAHLLSSNDLIWSLINSFHSIFTTQYPTSLDSLTVMGCLNTNNFSFSFLLFFFWMMKRHITLQSHDISCDMTS